MYEQKEKNPPKKYIKKGIPTGDRIQSSSALHMHCTENLNQIFLEMKLRSLGPNFYIHVSVSDWERGCAVSFLGIFVTNFRCSVLQKLKYLSKQRQLTDFHSIILVFCSV